MEFEPSARSIKIVNPKKIQIPKMRVCNVLDYGTLELEITDESFIERWIDMEGECKVYANFDWKSNISDGKFRVKYDERTHIFDEESNLIHTVPDLYNKFVTCIIELRSVYNFKNFSGISCRIHQMKVFNNYAFLQVDGDC